MDATAVAQLMLSQKLISSRICMFAFSDYHVNCLLLETFRKKHFQELAHFLQTTEKSNAMEVGLVEGTNVMKYDVSTSINWCWKYLV